MNTDTMNGAAIDFGGQVKQGLGTMLGDKSMEAEGKGEQLSGKTQKAFGDAKTTIDQSVRPLLDQARQFVKDRPFASAALGGVAGRHRPFSCPRRHEENCGLPRPNMLCWPEFVFLKSSRVIGAGLHITAPHWGRETGICHVWESWVLCCCQA